MSSNPLSTYRTLYDMALHNGHTEAIIFFRERILEQLRINEQRAKAHARIRYRIAVNRELIQHNGAMMALGFIRKNGQYVYP